MLSKTLQRTYLPGRAATPGTSASPAYTVCEQAPAPGHWETTWTTSRIPWAGGAYRLPTGARVLDIISVKSGGATTIYVLIGIPTSRWVADGPPGPIVCTRYPAVAATAAKPAVPARAVNVVRYGWDAGANSVHEEEEDCLCSFTMRIVSGAYVGLTSSPEEVPGIERLTHALYFHRTEFQVVEYGIAKTANLQFNAGDSFKIRRVGTQVTYLHNDRSVYASDDPSYGAVRVGAALYGSGDSIE